jgi:hypothetical protein
MFQLKPEDRLRSWREFRNFIETLPLEHALAQTAEFWAGAPFVPYSLDIHSPETWPDPWTLIYENVFCDVAKCLGIVYTVALTDHRSNTDIEFRIYQDPRTGYDYNLACFDQGKYILNMIDGEVVNIKQVNKTLKFKQQYTEKDLQLEFYY